MILEPGKTAWAWLAGIPESIPRPNAVPLLRLQGQAQRDPALRTVTGKLSSVPWPAQSGVAALSISSIYQATFPAPGASVPASDDAFLYPFSCLRPGPLAGAGGGGLAARVA